MSAQRLPTAAEERVPLSRERVLRAAIDLADAEGIESLTMRRLAKELHVEAMSLYHHVTNKDEILNGIVDLVVGEFELPEAGGDWRAKMRRAAISAHEVLLAHPWAASLVLSGAGISTARLRHMNAMLGCLRQAGFTADQTDHAYHALDSHIMGFTLWVVGMNFGTSENLAALAANLLQQLNLDKLPHLAEHVEQHLAPRDPEAEGEFVFGLNLVLDGLERIRVAPASPTARPSPRAARTGASR